MGSERFCNPPSLYRTEFGAPSPQQNGRGVNLTTYVLVPCFSKQKAAPPLCFNTASANTVTLAVQLREQTEFYTHRLHVRMKIVTDFPFQKINKKRNSVQH
jgi:hypothetical protein